MREEVKEKQQTLVKRTMVGVVSSDKMQKTVVVSVSRKVMDEKFGKYVTKVSKFKAHSENDEAKEGDKVVIVESRPISRQKRWRVQSILEKARQE